MNCPALCCAVLNHVRLFAIPWTVAHQSSLSMRFPRQEYWSGLPCPPPGDLPPPRDGTCISCVSCIGKWILYLCTTWEDPRMNYIWQIVLFNPLTWGVVIIYLENMYMMVCICWDIQGSEVSFCVCKFLMNSL